MPQIAICDFNSLGLEETKDRVGEIAPNAEVLLVRADLRNEQNVEEMVQIIVATFGRLDYAVNAAGELTRYSSFVLTQDRRGRRQPSIGGIYFNRVRSCQQRQLPGLLAMLQERDCSDANPTTFARP